MTSLTPLLNTFVPRHPYAVQNLIVPQHLYLFTLTYPGTYPPRTSYLGLLSGILDAFSAGLLIYDSIVNIIVPHFSQFAATCPSKGVQARQLVAFWAGIAVMAVLGKWA